MTGVADVARFEVRRIARGVKGGVGRASGRIRHQHLLEGLKAHPVTQGLVRGLQGEGKPKS